MQHSSRNSWTGTPIARRTLLASAGSLAALAAVAQRARADAALSAAMQPMALPIPPVTARHPVRIERWGMVRTDDYQWLHNPEWFTRLQHPESLEPAIRRHLEAENEYCHAVMQPTDGLQSELITEMQRRGQGGGDSPPEPDGDWIYWSSLRSGAQQPAYWRKPRAGGSRRLLHDFDTAARGHRYYRLSSLKAPSHSPDGKRFAWAVDERGDEHFSLHVLDLETGKECFAAIEDCFGDFTFSPDSQGIFWLWRDAHSRPAKVFRRALSGGADELVYEEHDPAFFMTLSRTSSNAYLVIEISNASTSEIRLIPANRPTASPFVVEPRTPGLGYTVEHWGDRFIVRTNADGAVDYALMTTAETTPGRAHWRPWIAYRPGRRIAEMRAFRADFAWIEWEDANPVLVIRPQDDASRERRIICSDAAYVLTLDANAAYDSALVRFFCQSPRMPPQWEYVDTRDGTRSVAWRQRPGLFRPDDYVVERIEAPSADGASVPISLLRHRDTARHSRAPLMLYGYGAYGFSLQAEFSAPDLSLADRGWMVAIAHVRGGAERGTAWFTQTLTTGKSKTVADFVACAEHLAATGYTSKGRIVGHSFSAGGILIGGAINVRPDLFAGAIGQVPFVDVLNTMQDTSNPLVASALQIWGDPADPVQYRAMAGYAPYETVRRQPYPAVLATAGLLDDRVGYWEAAKWIARLRERSTSSKPMMLLTNMHAGHQGDAGVDDLLRQKALFYAFAIRAVSHAWD